MSLYIRQDKILLVFQTQNGFLFEESISVLLAGQHNPTGGKK